jgi:protein-tyrosine phosphatase
VCDIIIVITNTSIIGGFSKFSSFYPHYCEYNDDDCSSLWIDGVKEEQQQQQQEDDYIVNSSSLLSSTELEQVELEQEEILELSTIEDDELLQQQQEQQQQHVSLVHTMSRNDRLRLCHARLFTSFSSKLSCEAPSELLPFLYLGSAQNAYNLDQLQQLNVKCIVNAAIEVESFYPEHFEYYKCNLMDDENADVSVYFEETYQFIEKARKSKRKILIQCFMGMSRSASIAIAYLMRAKKWSMKKAYSHVKKIRPIIDINTVFMYQLMQLEYNMFGKSSFPSNMFRKAIAHCNATTTTTDVTVTVTTTADENEQSNNYR